MLPFHPLVSHALTIEEFPHNVQMDEFLIYEKYVLDGIVLDAAGKSFSFVTYGINIENISPLYPNKRSLLSLQSD